MRKAYISTTNESAAGSINGKMMLSPVDIHQEELTRKHIIPNLTSIIKDFEELRDAVDRSVDRFFSKHYGFQLKHLVSHHIGHVEIFDPDIVYRAVEENIHDIPQSRLENFPVGECLIITKIVLSLFNDDTLVKGKEGFSILREFIGSGGNFHIIWGGIRGVFFQTAFQAGNYYIDVANNTVDHTKPKIVHFYLNESGFQGIESYDDYIPIKSGYHHVNIYLNNCFPGLLPYYPLLVASELDGQLAVDTSLYMARLNIETCFQTVTDAILSPRLEKTLDDAVLERIGKSVKHIEGGQNKREFMNFRVLSKAEMVRLLQNHVSHVKPSEHFTRLKAAGKTAQVVNFFWQKGRLSAF